MQVFVARGGGVAGWWVAEDSRN